MGYLFAFVMIVAMVATASFLAGRATAPDRSIRKEDLLSARRALSEMSAVSLRYYDSSDMVGREMIREIREIENNYWRGVTL
jgi:hypothetical protein